MTRYPRVLAPGGSEKIEASIDTRQVIGPFEKRIMVWSDDPVNAGLALYMTGEVKPYVILEPGGYLSLWGEAGTTAKGHIEILSNYPEPLEIMGIDHDLGDRIAFVLEQVIPGRSYRLMVEDRSGGPEEYTGRLVVRTNLLMKRDLAVIIKRHVAASGVAPQGTHGKDRGGEE